MKLHNRDEEGFAAMKNIKNILLFPFALLLFPGGVFAQLESIFVEQVSFDSSTRITQTGTEHEAITAQSGSNNHVVVTQEGGHQETDVAQLGTGHRFRATQSGQYNSIIGTQRGSQNKVEGFQNGEWNEIFFSQSGRNNSLTARQVGNQNTFDVTQDGDSNRAHYSVIDGNNNSITRVQTGHGRDRIKIDGMDNIDIAISDGAAEVATKIYGAAYPGAQITQVPNSGN